MLDTLLTVKDEGTILITVAFLENGDVLRSGQTGLQMFELDLIVSEDVTCDRFLGAIYAGLRDVLTSQYNLDLSRSIRSHGYRKERYTPPPIRQGQMDTGKLRPNIGKEQRLRTYALMQNVRSRKIAAMEEKMQFETDRKTLSSLEMEKIGWVACWQVFHECFGSYNKGYPDEQRVIPGKSKFGVIARCASGGCNNGEEHQNRLLKKPVIWLNRAAHGSRTLRQLGFRSGSKLVFDPLLMRGSPAVLEQTVWLPRKHTCDAQGEMVEKPDLELIRIDAPMLPAEVESRNVIPTVLSPLITTGSVIAAWLATGANMEPSNIGWTMGTMVASTVAVSLINGGARGISKKKAAKNYLQDYQQYICRTIDTLNKSQYYATGFAKHRRPAVWAGEKEDSLLYRVVTLENPIVGCRGDDADFLWGRLGITLPGSRLVKSPISVEGCEPPPEFSVVKYVNLKPTPEKPFRITKGKVADDEAWGYLKNLPEDLAAAYGYVDNAPVGLNLREHTSAAVVLENRKQDFRPLLDNLLLDLCANHSPEDLQVVWFLEETDDWQQRHQKISFYKYLPHGRQLLDNHGQFVFSKTDAQHVLDKLNQICSDREKWGANGPHILVLFEKMYDVEDNPLLSRLSKNMGITCLYCCRGYHEVPKSCTYVVECDSSGQWFLLPGNGEKSAEQKMGLQYQFQPDRLHTQEEIAPFRTAFAKISSWHDRRKKGGTFGDTYSLFQLLVDYCASLGIPQPQLYTNRQDRTEQLASLQWQLHSFVRQRRSGYVVGKDRFDTMSVPIGESRDGVVCLDLHEEADGPHLLLTDEEGSGKAKAISTYLLSLFTHYGPEVMDVVMLTVAGGEALNAVGQLPQVTLLSPKASDTQAVLGDLLQTLLQTLVSEMEERKRLLSKAGVTTADAYNRLLYKLQHQRKAKWSAKLAGVDPSQLKPMVHHVMVLDDYQQWRALAAQTALGDLDQVLYRLIREAQGLGIHLILAAKTVDEQLPEVLTDCFRAKLHLTPKVADPGNLGGYLSSGSYIRRALRIADSSENIACRPCEPFRVTLATTQGFYRSFFDSETYRPYGYEQETREAANSQEKPREQTQSTPEGQTTRCSIDGGGPTQRNLHPGAHQQSKRPQAVDIRPGEYESTEPMSTADRRPAGWRSPQEGRGNSTADRRPVGWCRENRSNKTSTADRRPVGWSILTEGKGSRSTADRRPAGRNQENGTAQGRERRNQYRLADEVFFTPCTFGVNQGQFLAQLLADYDQPPEFT